MKTLVLGASPNPERYSYLAVQRLVNNGHETVAVGIRKDSFIEGLPILLGQPQVRDVHTVTLYLNPTRQEAYYNYLLSLKPKRVIFNPGTENAALIKLLKENEVEPVIACTLVMLSTGQY